MKLGLSQLYLNTNQGKLGQNPKFQFKFLFGIFFIRILDLFRI